MLVVMQSHASEEKVRAVCQRIESLGLRAHPIPGTIRTAIGITGNKGAVDLGVLESMSGVVECIPVSKPYKLVSRDAKEEDSILRIPTPSGDVIVGGTKIALVAGPCAVESEEQALAIAERLVKTGVRLFRGGAYKPRTSPYSFQGLGEPGLKILAKVRQKFGFGIITEAIDNESLDLVEEYADVIQIGARNMQNFSLLKRAGRAKKPVLRFFPQHARPRRRTGRQKTQPPSYLRRSVPRNRQAPQSSPAFPSRRRCRRRWTPHRSPSRAGQNSLRRHAVHPSRRIHRPRRRDASDRRRPPPHHQLTSP